MKTIGIVGAGRMGANMARRLHDCGFTVVAVYDSQSKVAHALADELSTTACSLLADVSQLADVIITVVSDDAAMQDIYHRDGDNLFQNGEDKLFVNCATISPAVHLALMTEAASLGASMLECPMASSITQAREGTLYLMCAGEKAVFEKAQPILKAMSSACTYTGPAGSASQMKALVNMVMNINTAGLAEGLGLADALGLDLNMVRTIFSQTGAASRVLETDGDDMQNREHDVYFSAAHAAKDSGIALALAKAKGLPLPLAQASFEQYTRMTEAGLGELDKSGVSELTFPSRRSQSISNATPLKDVTPNKKAGFGALAPENPLIEPL